MNETIKKGISAKQKVIATVLSPLHVGSGDKLHENLDWLYESESQKVVFLDDAKVFAAMGEKTLNIWVNRISKDRRENLLRFLQEQKATIKATDLGTQQADLYPPFQKPEKEIFSITRDGQGRPLLPGSSLKGSLRTAYFNFLLYQNPRLPGSNLYDSHTFKDKGLSQKLFSPNVPRGKAPNFDSFKLVQVSDFAFGQTAIGGMDVISATGDGNCDFRTDLRNFAEWIPAGSRALGYLKLDTQKPLLEEKIATQASFSKSRPQSLTQIMKVANERTIQHLEEELTYAERLDLPKQVAGLPNHVRELLETAQGCEANECVIHTGMGVGYKGITGNWVKDYLSMQEQKKLAAKARRGKKHDERLPFPRSRKLAPEGWPPGYVKLSILSAEKEQAMQREAERIKAEQATREAEAKKAAAEAEKERQEEEARQRQPQFFTGPKIKEMQSELEAVISQVSSKPYKAKVYLYEPEVQELEFVGYNNPPLGEIVIVYPAQVTKKGVIKQVKFKAFKNK